MTDSPRARLRRARSSLASGDAAAASAILAELGAEASPRTADAVLIHGLLARALAEQARWDEALEAADRALSTADPDPGRLVRAEVLIWAQRLDEARDLLETVREDNIVGRGLRDALQWLAPDRAVEERQSGEPRPYPGDPAALWFEPAFAVVLLFLETRLRLCNPSPELHALHCGFFQPELHYESIPSAAPDLVERCLAPLRGTAWRARRRRAREVYAHYRRGDLEGFARALQEWIDQEPVADRSAYPLDDDRVGHLLKCVFLEGRFEDYVDRARRLRKGLEDGDLDLSFHLRSIYAKMALGRLAEASRELSRFVREGGLEAGKPGRIERAGSAHLLGKLELAREQPERAAAWFRRAFSHDDMAVVDLARMEFKFLGWTLERRSTGRRPA